MNYYIKGLIPDNPEETMIVASGHSYNRTVYTYPGIPDLNGWECVMRDGGITFFDEDGEEVPEGLLLTWLDESEEITYQHNDQPVI